MAWFISMEQGDQRTRSSGFLLIRCGLCMSPAQHCGRESSKQSGKTCITSRFEAIKMALRDQESNVGARWSRVNAGTAVLLVALP